MYCNLVELSFVSYECMVVSLNYDVKLNLKYCSTDTFLYKVRTKLTIQKNKDIQKVEKCLFRYILGYVFIQ